MGRKKKTAVKPKKPARPVRQSTGPTTMVKLTVETRDRLKAMAEQSRPPSTMMDLLDTLVAEEEKRRKLPNQPFSTEGPIEATQATQAENSLNVPDEQENRPAAKETAFSGKPRRRLSEHLREELEGPDWRS